MSLSFLKEMDFSYGVAATTSPLIRRIIAKNPSPFTFHGTGTYIVGHGEVAVIDPGPNLTQHIDALMKTLKGEVVTHILITHTHRDHSPAASALQDFTGAKTFGFGPHNTQDRNNTTQVEEGADLDFIPDQKLQHGDVLEGRDWHLQALHTPGHCSNHLCFHLEEEKALFSGDHVMGWSTTVISPPDGNMSDYLNSLRSLLQVEHNSYWPTHGPPIMEPDNFVRSLILHRETREDQILECLKSGKQQIHEIVQTLYANVDSRLHPAAAQSVLAHLTHLVETNRATSTDSSEITSHFKPA